MGGSKAVKPPPPPPPAPTPDPRDAEDDVSRAQEEMRKRSGRRKALQMLDTSGGQSTTGV